jgi:hypothetical protein
MFHYHSSLKTKTGHTPMTSPLDTIPGPAFDPDDLQDALALAHYLGLAVFLCDGLDTADEVICVAPAHVPVGTPWDLWPHGLCGSEWFVQCNLETGRVEAAENGGALAYFETPSEALDYIAKTRLLRAQ